MAAATTLLGTQLSRHPSLTPLGVQTMFDRHPQRTSPATGLAYSPAVHRDALRGASIYLNGLSDRHGNRMLPDGVTIEYRPSNSPEITRQLDDLVGQEVTLYALVGREQAREGRVAVGKQEDPQGRGVYHLRLQPKAAPLLWADME
jgi:hypothetical protein